MLILDEGWVSRICIQASQAALKMLHRIYKADSPANRKAGLYAEAECYSPFLVLMAVSVLLAPVSGLVTVFDLLTELPVRLLLTASRLVTTWPSKFLCCLVTTMPCPVLWTVFTVW